MSCFQAASFGFVAFHVASTISVFNDVEDSCPTVPEKGGNGKSR